ncbi:MAG: 3-phosphoshikimate 1-carboxyvinyltransferase [Armatimonadetes bacterium]|nr:3-phosphoshikimate 1-carboxyvinyltransferase [Armatimonadota bacterium]
MEILAENSKLAGTLAVPGSKSHTVRSAFFALLSQGQSTIRAPLEARDTLAALGAAEAFGAHVRREAGLWIIEGVGSGILCPARPIDVQNSGTTLRIGMGVAALGEKWVVLTGDEQIRRRPAGPPLMQAYTNLGARAFSTRGDGCAPVAVRGPLVGGATEIDCPTSQYLSSLLINCPLAHEDTEIRVGVLNERPYVGLTLYWLDRLGIEYCHKGLTHFIIRGNQSYPPFDRRIPADFSSATFPLAAAAVTGSTLTLRGLDMQDPQGDKAVIGVLERIGCEVSFGAETVTITGGDVRGAEIDLNDTPDALPALAVVGAFASGETRLLNVPQARMKEVDRIACMSRELAKLGIVTEELPDGLIVRGGRPRGAVVQSHGDHRLAMALAVAGLATEGTTVVQGAEAIDVTYPSFVEAMQGVGAHIEVIE